MKLKNILPVLSEKGIVDRFHTLYYDSKQTTWANTFWMGVPCLKCPLDLWIYQEMLFALKPDRIVECGTAGGGSSFFLAHMCDLVGKGKVLTIDIEAWPNRPTHERVTYVLGSDISDEVVGLVREFVKDAKSVLVILDSDHSKEHVYKELNIYCKFVTPGSYIIVEDSNLGGHPVKRRISPGPMGAIKEFMAENTDFIADHGREKFYLTFNPSGYLKRVR